MSANKKEWKTEDLDTVRYNAGKLDEKGLLLIPESYEEYEGKNGPFMVLNGKELPENTPCQLLFSSAKLKRIITDNWDALKGQAVRISGFGEGFGRQYRVTLEG